MNFHERQKSFRGESISFLSMLVAAYLLLGGLFLFFYRFQLNPDGISYIRIAQRYYAGDFAGAVNGYWSPLLSWFTIPFVAKRSPLQAQFGIKILLLLIGLLTLLTAHFFSLRLGLSERSHRIFLISLVPMTVSFALSNITPDVLVVCILLLYFLVVFDTDYAEKRFAALIAGLLGGIGYLAKSFIFPFFLFHYTGMMVVHFLAIKSESRPKVIRQWMLGISAFFIIAGPWVLLISSKYDKWTVGNAGAFNFGMNAPGNEGFPMSKQMLPPFDNRAISVWEDPSSIKMPQWHSWRHQAHLTLENLKKMNKRLDGLNLHIFILAGLFFISTRSKESEKRFLAVSAILTACIYCGGYALIWVDRRYLWPILLLLFLMGLFIIEKIRSIERESNSRLMQRVRVHLKYLLPLILVISFLLHPVKELSSSIVSSPDEEVYLLSSELQKRGVSGRIASNGDWNDTLFLAYYLNARNFGVIPDAQNRKNLYECLRKHNIDYYFEWLDDTNGVPSRDLVHALLFQKAPSRDLPSLRIYRAKELMRIRQTDEKK